MDNYIFVYGTLLNKNIRNKILNRIIEIIEDEIDNYTLSKIEDSDGLIYPNIKIAKNKKVFGGIFKVSDKELKLLDEYETSLYVRELIKTKSGTLAWVYYA